MVDMCKNKNDVGHWLPHKQIYRYGQTNREVDTSIDRSTNREKGGQNNDKGKEIDKQAHTNKQTNIEIH